MLEQLLAAVKKQHRQLATYRVEVNAVKDRVYINAAFITPHGKVMVTVGMPTALVNEADSMMVLRSQLRLFLQPLLIN